MMMDTIEVGCAFEFRGWRPAVERGRGHIHIDFGPFWLAVTWPWKDTP